MHTQGVCGSSFIKLSLANLGRFKTVKDVTVRLQLMLTPQRLEQLETYGGPRASQGFALKLPARACPKCPPKAPWRSATVGPVRIPTLE